MFLGHFAVAYASKTAEPKTSLGTAFLAAQLPDVLWPFLVLAGVERVAIAPGDTAFTPLRFEHYPISHSLLTVAGWAALFALLHWLSQRRLRSALVLAGLVLSHWLLDFVSHRPDMPLRPGGTQFYGLGLWNSVPATLVVEGLMFAAGLLLYFRSGRAKDAIGRFGAPALAALLVLFYVGAAFGPPPPSVTAMAAVTASGGLIALLAAFVDRHRKAR